MAERIILGQDDEAPTIVLTRAGDGDVTVTAYYGEDDGLPVVQIDTEQHAVVRVNVNDGELATVHDGGDRIVMPEHHGEFEQPVIGNAWPESDTAPCARDGEHHQRQQHPFTECPTAGSDEDDESEFEEAVCGCGYPIINTPEGWQHNAAPYFWGDDHDAEPS